MVKPLVPADTHTGDTYNDRLHALVVRIASGDRTAFRTVYAFLAMQVWRDAVRLLPPADSRAVTRSTLLEIRHLAGHHLDHERCEIRVWIRAITARQIGDRLRVTDGGRPLRCEYDHHTHQELVSLLGSGCTAIRTSPATFTRVVDHDP
jgi:hypothetical protein